MKTVQDGDLTFYYDVEQGTQEWLDLRKGKVTCSNALVLLTKGKTAAILANKDSAERITPNGNRYAERGHVIEAEYKEQFNAVLKSIDSGGLEIDECGFITNSQYPDAGYSPDGLVVDVSKTIITFAEYKAYNDFTTDELTGEVTSISFKHRKACQDISNVPAACIAQCNLAMLITGADYMMLFLCNPDASQTDRLIVDLYKSTDPAKKEVLYENGMLDEDGYLNDTALKPTDKTHVWKIERDERIIARLKEKLSHPMPYQLD